MSASEYASSEEIRRAREQLEAMRKSIDARGAPEELADRREKIEFAIRRFGGDGWEENNISEDELRSVNRELIRVQPSEVAELHQRVEQVSASLQKILPKNDTSGVMDDVDFDREQLENPKNLRRGEFDRMCEQYHDDRLVNQVVQRQDQQAQNNKAALIHQKASHLLIEHDAGNDDRQSKFDTVFVKDLETVRELKDALKSGPLSAKDKVQLDALGKKYEGSVKEIVARVTAEIEPVRATRSAGRPLPVVPTAKSPAGTSARMPTTEFDNNFNKAAEQGKWRRAQPKTQEPVMSRENSPRSSK